MESKIKKTTEIILKMNLKEALWLKGLVQNYLGDSLHTESTIDREIRKLFWDALENIN